MRGEKVARIGLGALVAGLVVAGLIAVGGPGAGRTERQDEVRFDDLHRLENYVRCVADTDGGTLPLALEPVRTCEGEHRFEDPYTGAAYRYERVSDTAFLLCADFGDVSRINGLRGGTIDPRSGCLQFTYVRS